MEGTYDIIVVGLGPAGATISRELQRGGLRVVAFDRERFPRYKPCGGCLSKKIDDILDVDIQKVVEHTIRGAVFTHAFERELTILSERPIGYMVQRDRFDSLLVEMARAEGVEVRDGEGVSMVMEGDGYIEAVTEKGIYRGRYLVGADGPFSVVARTFFPGMRRNLGVAIEGEARAPKELLERMEEVAWIDFGYIPHGYGWVFPKDGVLSIGIGGIKREVEDIKSYFYGFLKGKGLESLEFLNLKGWVIPAFSGRSFLPAKEKVVLIGDAGSMVDPFLGEGIYYAIKSAKVVGREILRMWDSVRPESIGEALEKGLYGDFEAADRVADLVYGYPDLWYTLLENNPSLMEDYYMVLRGERDYQWFSRDIRNKVKGSISLWFRVTCSLFLRKVRRLLRGVLKNHEGGDGS